MTDRERAEAEIEGLRAALALVDAVGFGAHQALGLAIRILNNGEPMTEAEHAEMRTAQAIATHHFYPGTVELVRDASGPLIRPVARRT